MKILIDTHIFLWAAGVTRKLPKRILDLLADDEIEKFLSVASAWEIVIKYARGNLVLPEHPKTFVPASIEAAGIIPLPIRFQDALSVADLPPHHRDPFDRLLITQARLNGLHVLTDDRVFEKYDVEIIGI